MIVYLSHIRLKISSSYEAEVLLMRCLLLSDFVPRIWNPVLDGRPTCGTQVYLVEINAYVGSQIRADEHFVCVRFGRPKIVWPPIRNSS